MGQKTEGGMAKPEQAMDREQTARQEDKRAGVDLVRSSLTDVTQAGTGPEPEGRVLRQALNELYALRVRLERARELQELMVQRGLAGGEADREAAALESAIEALEPMAEAFLVGVDDLLLREAFRMRFFQGLSWRQIAGSFGGYMSEESLRQAVCRYFNRLEQQRQ